VREIVAAPLTTNSYFTYKHASNGNGSIAVDTQNKNVLYLINLFRDFVQPWDSLMEEVRPTFKPKPTLIQLYGHVMISICTIAVIHLAHDIGDQDC
jgi:hypothetical protein